MQVRDVIDLNWGDEVERSAMPVVVDFWAPWCGPCRQLSPIVEELAKELSTVKFCKYNVDEGQEYSDKFGIRSVPTLLLFKDGALVETIVGGLDKAKLTERLTKTFEPSLS